MKSLHLVLLALGLFFCSCSTSITKRLGQLKAGQAIIKKQNGAFSDILNVEDAFSQLNNNEILYIAAGRAILKNSIQVRNLNNVQIIGKGAALVAKEDMPVLTLSGGANIQLSGFLVVHEIGDKCTQNCVEFYNAKDITIKECSFDGSGYYGLALSNITNAVVENCKMFNCEYGLAAWDSKNIELKNNEFSKNRSKDILGNDMSQFSSDVKINNTFK